MKMIRNQERRTDSARLRFAWVALVLFAVVIGLLGGSSRTDVNQIVGLRPLAALFLVPALYFLTRQKLAEFRVPVILLGLLTLWTALQLVPLPPGIWQSLPGRGAIAELGQQLGQADLWRPISMVPSRGYNALAGMIVPVTALLLIVGFRPGRRTVFIVLIALGVANGLLGIMQVIGDPQGPLYFYRITNFGSAVGLFANHNHSAVFASLTMLTIAYAATNPQFGFTKQLHRIPLAALFLLMLLVALIGGSRAGLLTALLALGASAFLFWNRWRSGQRGGGKSGKITFNAPVALGAGILAIAAMIALFVAFDRIPALGRMTETTEFEDLRWSLFPILREMMGTYWLTGSGFGSFEEAYHIHEPVELMFASYVNQAHNDLAQLIIEGGLPALLLLFGFLAWVTISLRQMLRTMMGGSRIAASGLVYWTTTFVIIMFASLFDYPLRAPIFQMAAVWLVAVFALEQSRATELQE